MSLVVEILASRLPDDVVSNVVKEPPNLSCFHGLPISSDDGG